MLHVLVLKMIEYGDECEIYLQAGREAHICICICMMYLYDEDECDIYFQAGREAQEIQAWEGNFGQCGVSF